MQLAVEFQGRSGLVMHHPRLADHNDVLTRRIDETNAKQKKTDADLAERDRLEWVGCLYHDADIGLHVPAANIIRCMVDAAVATKKGTAIRQGFTLTADRIPLQINAGGTAPDSIEDLYKQPEFRLRISVVVQRNRVMRMRPIFRRWSLTFDAFMDEDVLNLSELLSIAQRAGNMGLLEARKIGYGRFDAVVAAEDPRADRIWARPNGH